MTRRPRRRATSDPRRVGSDEGLTSSRPRSEPEGTDAGDAAESGGADPPTKTSGRHTAEVEQTADDTDEGWGERGDGDASARWLRENRPPHWS